VLPKDVPHNTTFYPVWFAEKKSLLTYIGGPKVGQRGSIMISHTNFYCVGNSKVSNFLFLCFVNSNGSLQKEKKQDLGMHPILLIKVTIRTFISKSLNYKARPIKGSWFLYPFLKKQLILILETGCLKFC